MQRATKPRDKQDQRTIETGKYCKKKLNIVQHKL